MNYIKKHAYGIEVDGEVIVDDLKRYLDRCCLKEYSTLDGRITASSKILNERYKLPFYVSEKITLFPTSSLRNYDVVLLNYITVLSVKKIDDSKTLVHFVDLSSLIVSCPCNLLKKQLKRCENLLQKKVFTQPTY